MNLEFLTEAARTALRAEYDSYDAVPGRAHLAILIANEPVPEEQVPLPRGHAAPSSTWIEDWSAHAACRDNDPDELFTQGAAQNRAKAVCTGCPVRTECLADALDNRVEFGAWGGLTERERRALLRRRPGVGSWRRLLETARAEYESTYQPLGDDVPETPVRRIGDDAPATTDWPDTYGNSAAV